MDSQMSKPLLPPPQPPPFALHPTPTLHQACQDAIDQIEKRNETFKAAVQSPEGDPQEQEVNSGSVFLPPDPAWSCQLHTGMTPSLGST